MRYSRPALNAITAPKSTPEASNRGRIDYLLYIRGASELDNQAVIGSTADPPERQGFG